MNQTASRVSYAKRVTRKCVHVMNVYRRSYTQLWTSCGVAQCACINRHEAHGDRQRVIIISNSSIIVIPFGVSSAECQMR